MAHDYYSHRSHTPGLNRTTIDIPVRSRRTEEVPNNEFQQMIHPQTPVSGLTARRRARARDSHAAFTSAHTDERNARSRQADDSPYDDFGRLSLASAQSKSRPTYTTLGNVDGNRPRLQETSTRFYDRPPASVPTPRGQRPPSLIVGLFSLRLARRLILQLDLYPERAADLAWIDSFLSFYSPADDLAELKGTAMDEFAKTYPVIVNHFIKERRYPTAFMSIDPTPRGGEAAGRRLTDKEARDMVDFADAAAEWGSCMKLPGQERERMEALAAQRRIAR